MKKVLFTVLFFSVFALSAVPAFAQQMQPCAQDYYYQFDDWYSDPIAIVDTVYVPNGCDTVIIEGHVGGEMGYTAVLEINGDFVSGWHYNGDFYMERQWMEPGDFISFAPGDMYNPSFYHEPSWIRISFYVTVYPPECNNITYNGPGTWTAPSGCTKAFTYMNVGETAYANSITLYKNYNERSKLIYGGESKTSFSVSAGDTIILSHTNLTNPTMTSKVIFTGGSTPSGF